jgi:hypothetical protein
MKNFIGEEKGRMRNIFSLKNFIGHLSFFHLLLVKTETSLLCRRVIKLLAVKVVWLVRFILA